MPFSKEIDWQAELFHLAETSRYRYSLPIHAPEVYLWQTSPAHHGHFRHAVDIPVPNPDLEETIVYAPQSGIIEEAVLFHQSWGPTLKYAITKNYVIVRVGGNEYYELAHIRRLDSLIDKPLIVGQKINQGEPIAKIGLNGWITATNGIPDSHLHFMVSKKILGINQYTSLRIRWNSVSQD